MIIQNLMVRLLDFHAEPVEALFLILTLKIIKCCHAELVEAPLSEPPSTSSGWYASLIATFEDY